jgi:hypothetical protein
VLNEGDKKNRSTSLEREGAAGFWLRCLDGN